MTEEEPRVGRKGFKTLYVVAAVLFSIAAIVDLFDWRNPLKLAGSILLAVAWILLAVFYPNITQRRREMIMVLFVLAIILLFTRLVLYYTS